MTQDELMALPEHPYEFKALWREDYDPIQIWDDTGKCWTVFRIKGERYRMRVSQYDQVSFM